MPYSEKLADRVREALVDMPGVEEKKMFSGISFMVDDKMCINVMSQGLMCRIDPERYEELLEKRACRSMVMKGKELKGYLVVEEEEVQRKKELDFWIAECLEYNPRAKSSKKKGGAAPVKKKEGAAPVKKKKPVANQKK